MAQAMQGGLVGQLLGAYTLEALIGAGGMAEVYRARDAALGREVAVKVLPRTLAEDAGYVARFRAEARHVASLTHPAIVPIYSYGEEHGLLYLVMPILRESLRERLDREGPLPQREAIRLTTQIATGLQAAHELGIIHRDVKPENILLDAEGNALLTDFGIAREQQLLQRSGARTLAATGLPIGTPEYMSPEQLRGEPLDQRADLYALGAVFYELLTGEAPFVADSVYEVAASVLKDSIPPPSQRRPDLWPALEVVTLKAMARSRQNRYPDMRAFIRALNDLNSTRTPSPTTATGMPTVGQMGSLRPGASPSAAYQAGLVNTTGTMGQSGIGLRSLADVDTDRPPLRGQTSAKRTVGSQHARFWPSEPLSAAAAAARSAGKPTERGPTGTKPLNYGKWSRRRRRRALLGSLAAVLLVGASGALLIAQTGVWRLGGAMNAAATTTIQAYQTGAAQTAQAMAQTPTQPTATTAPTATVTATAVPQPVLNIFPEPLTLAPVGKNSCSATQTVRNTSAQTIGWSWNMPAIPGLQFSVNGKPFVSWPEDTKPGIAPGDKDTISVFMNRCQTFSRTITLTDTLGATYTFNLQSTSGDGN
ncbi:MAG: serine/threonine-protein kinase [Ktedonobacterales bacterium]